MEKTFDVVGITKNSIICRGLAFMPKQRFNLVLSESELNFFRQFVDIVQCTEIVEQVKPTAQEPTPQVAEEPKIEEHKEAQDDKARTTRKTQNKSKKQV